MVDDASYLKARNAQRKGDSVAENGSIYTCFAPMIGHIDHAKSMHL